MRLGLILVAWFSSSAFFNDATPRLMRTLESVAGINVDVTALELGITILIAAGKLMVQNERPLPPPSLVGRVMCVGTSHLVGCRLFIWGLQYIPVSIAQTIRAANPVVTVAMSVLILREPLPSLAVLAALGMLIAGFALAVLDGSGNAVDLSGVAAAVGSVCCLTLTNTFSKRLLSPAASAPGTPPVSSGELQCWICIAAFAALAPYWLWSGGLGRLHTAFSGAASAELGRLCALDGVLYFTEQTLQFAAISRLSPLTLAVLDTTRRLFIVVVAGFVLQGDPVTAARVGGALVVYAGAAAYAWTTHLDAGAATRVARKAR